jgi:hypothetical protein
MPRTHTSFKSQQAPCGRIVDGEQHQDRDEECLLADDLHYACGCRSTYHQYHDGSVRRQVVRHDGAVLVNEFLAAE